ncbi:hypothetical protein C0081_00210 [Cohaesibacter celericrescens]|uniref:Auto-transporter adhesin head GIN domain-containing protein n=1 Tax=Cohaesibacter celericrescens TaxID=2067669 RepID=A0A2N5XW39_9HYPH|nr:hypothetical protein C0081_00210 [Cohaesibacter celericrescens]
MTRRDPFTQSSHLPFAIVCLIVLMIAAMLTSGSALAQSENTPMSLGDVLQKSTQGAPAPRVYLKLPQTVPIPRNNPVRTNPAAATQPAGPGQIAPNTTTGQSSQGEPARTTESPTVEQAETQEPAPPKIQPGGIAKLKLEALLSSDGQVLQRGVNWRVFEEKRDKNSRLPLLHNVDGGSIDLELDPGSYVVYAGYGYANLTKRIVLEKAGNYSESFNLQAGAVRLNAVATGDVPLDASILTFDIYNRDTTDGDTQKLLVQNVKPEHVVKLTEGTYHVVSSYGASNAKVRGDIEILSGKLINVTMIHSAAKVTLRLVSEPGGEALANTVWTVLTPGGDVVKRAIGAFPTLALTAGDYTAIAKQNDEVYNRDFSVDSGLDRDIEVLAKVQ